MEEEEDLVACQNCSEKFPSFKIDLHEAYCRRNIKKCKICATMVDINEEELHFNQFHAEEPCQFCQQSIQTTEMSAHKEICEKRPIECKYCQNPFPSSSIPRHQEECGSRTRRCETCRSYVKIREYESHVANCQFVEPPRNESNEVRRNNQFGAGLVPLNRNRLRSNEKIKKEQTRDHIDFKGHKPNATIGREPITQLVDPVPISVRLTIQRQKQKRGHK